MRIAVSVALALAGCASPSWVGRHVPVDGSWGPPPGGKVLLTIDRQAEDGAASGTIAGRNGRSVAVTLRPRRERALSAPGVDLGDGLAFPHRSEGPWAAAC